MSPFDPLVLAVRCDSLAAHGRTVPKQRRAGCLLCKPSKLNATKTADRMQARRLWRRSWRDDIS
jgi:hypothetical protein